MHDKYDTLVQNCIYDQSANSLLVQADGLIVFLRFAGTATLQNMHRYKHLGSVLVCSIASC
jgi:hypothetical protein